MATKYKPATFKRGIAAYFAACAALLAFNLFIIISLLGAR